MDVGSFVRRWTLHVLPPPYDTRAKERFRLALEGWTTRHSSPLSLHQQMKVHFLGYTTKLYYLYGFDGDHSPENYLSDYSRTCAKIINDEPDILDDKELFYNYLAERGFDQYLPELFGCVENGEFTSDGGHGLEELCNREGKIVLKEVRGGGGAEVYIGNWTGEGMKLHGGNDTPCDPDAIVEDLNRAIVTAFCEQAEYLNDIYPGSANTIRIVSMNPENGEPFIAAAAHRFGTRKSGLVDNISQGGICTAIDVETGELSAAVTISDEYRVQWYDHHPDTGAQIRGVEIPDWQRIVEKLFEMICELPEVKYAGWDILVTESGEFVFLESNNYPDPILFQPHRPLLVDPKVREFYASNGIPM